MNIRQMFLLITAIGLTPIALSYGLVPQVSLKFLYGLTVTDTNTIHIFRAVMGLYLALVLFWLTGVFKVQFRQAALYSLVVFMFGLAVGRIFSVIVDGFPHWLLTIYILVEALFGALGILVAKKAE